MSNNTRPSMDAWLAEAKKHESAPLCGMYLTHNGVVRERQKRKCAADRRAQNLL